MDFWVGLKPHNLVSLRAVLQGAGTAMGLTPEPGWRQVGGLGAVPWVPPSPPSPGAGLWGANGSISTATAPQHPSAARFMGCSEASLSLSPELINSLAIGARAN